MKPSHFILLAAILILQPLSPVRSAEPEPTKNREGDLRLYVLKECIVSGQMLEADACTFKYENREIKTCCDQCMNDFFQDPESFVERINEAEQQAAKAKQKEKAKTSAPKKAEKK